MTIYENAKSKTAKFTRKKEWWSKHGIKVSDRFLPAGDFTANSNVLTAIKSMYSITELIKVLYGKQKESFEEECRYAQKNGITYIVLIENFGGELDENGEISYTTFRDLEDLKRWHNPRLSIYRNGKQLYPTAKSGNDIYAACVKLQTQYGVRFELCHPVESPKRILDLLRNGVNFVELNRNKVAKNDVVDESHER